ncbi:hypothetical protein HXX76_009975 [Chlamydomonas incerta]|uniref:F-box/LRR-repeat protein 15-like leucin rich repeat domain-containing protein n=1 Tax=Chlamydomonas incerta TaxID=51695 RepID=A0A835VV36_CHLIN|nr:hypothetical protein HXX76_009975 [Chlamydomonas incerta]|eukprot:KAG2430452.1 hypothetical protein HXX76_009975 [Chlamydomonas incerta]
MAKRRAEKSNGNGAEDRGGREGIDLDRREGMAAIARKRAAHFANFQDDGDDTDGNIHAGGDQARTLGPWSSAMELVNAREKAQHERQAKLQAAEETEQEGEADAAAQWQPSRDPALGPHPRDPVRPLFGQCLDVLTSYIECVESLWGVPDAIKVRLAAHVCARRKMSPEAARLFATSAPTEVLVPDCTQLDAPAMADLLREVAGPRLQRLELGFCGRGFGDEAAALVAAGGGGGGRLEELESLTLDGAYRLSDAGLIKLLSATPALRRLSVAQGSRLTSALLAKLPELVPQLTHLNLADCRGLGAEALAAALPRLQQLRAVRLDLIPEVDDAVLVALGTQLPRLAELSLRCCQAVTDGGLTALAASARGPHLELLRIDECGGRVTDAALAALASQCRAIKVFSARRCTKLGDEALAELLRAGSVTHLCLSGVAGVGPAVAGALAACCRESLEELDVSFCRKLPDRSLGLVLGRCGKLRRLAVFGCSQLSAASLYGHSNAGLVIEGVHTKVDLDLGLAQKRAAAVAGAEQGEGATGEGARGEGEGKDLEGEEGAPGGGEGDAEEDEEQRGGRAGGSGGGAAAAAAAAAAPSPEGKAGTGRGKKGAAQDKKAAAGAGSEAGGAGAGRKRRVAGEPGATGAEGSAGAGGTRPRKGGKKAAAAAPADEALEAAKQAPPAEEWF